MTTLVGLHVPGEGTWLGGDLRLSTEYIHHGPFDKWTSLEGGYTMGVAGHARSISVLRANITRILSPKLSVEQVCQAFRDAMARDGFQIEHDDSGPGSSGQSIMLATGEGLWLIDSSMFHYPAEPGVLWAKGSGCDYAMGAGMALEGVPPQERVKEALRVACHYDPRSGHGTSLRFLPAKRPVGRAKKASGKLR